MPAFFHLVCMYCTYYPYICIRRQVCIGHNQVLAIQPQWICCPLLVAPQAGAKTTQWARCVLLATGLHLLQEQVVPAYYVMNLAATLPPRAHLVSDLMIPCFRSFSRTSPLASCSTSARYMPIDPCNPHACPSFRPGPSLIGTPT